MQVYSTFEQTYRNYPFSELVSLGIKLGEMIKRFRNVGSDGAGLSGTHAIEPAR